MTVEIGKKNYKGHLGVFTLGISRDIFYIEKPIGSTATRMIGTERTLIL